MTRLTRPRREADPGATPAKVILLAIASLIPPMFLFAWSLQTRDGVDGVGAVACAVLYLLMLSQLWDVASSRRRGLVRERTLRLAGALLA